MINSEVWKIINSCKCSSSRRNGQTVIRDASEFKPLPQSARDDIVGIESGWEKNEAAKSAHLRTVKDVSDDFERSFRPRVEALVRGKIADQYASARPPTYSGFDMGGLVNEMTGQGARGFDPAKSWRPTQRLWLTPYDACAIYSQGGFAEIIVNKKSDSVLLNGINIKNPKYTPAQLKEINERASLVHNFAHVVAEAIKWSLVYGGSIVFPFFKTDNPVSTAASVKTLLKSGAVDKGCIDRFCVLDRWNVVHIPQWNPTAEDFQNPKTYFIPFLGADLNGERTSRINTSPQPGYIGVLQTMGWGLSDMVSWYESLFNYEGVMSTIPTMINQMSIIARTINVDGLLAADGIPALAAINDSNAESVRMHTALNDPITLDVMGNLQSIDRDFSDVYQLVRLLRQDWCGKAKIPEELILSSEKAAFSSEDSEGTSEKMWENVKYTHKLVAKSLLNMAYFLVIDALGSGSDVMENLRYTSLEFDNPAVTDGRKKAELFKDFATGVFDLASATVPASIALKLMKNVAQTDVEIDEDILKEMDKRQAEIDERQKKQFDMQMKQSQASLNNPMGMKPPTAGGGSGAKAEGGVNGMSPQERLEHKSKSGVSEKTAGGEKTNRLGMRMTGRGK